MYLTCLKNFLSREEVKIVSIGTVTGGILQVAARYYLKTHPEFMEDIPVTKRKFRLRRFFSPRGGAFIEISKISVKIILSVMAKKGLIAGLAASGAVAINKIPATAVSAFLRDAFPQNLPDLDKKKFILVNRDKIYLDQYDQNLKYLFNILKDETIYFDDKKN